MLKPTIVFRRFKDEKGADAFEKYTLDDIDAREAVKNCPKEWAFEEWPKSDGKVVDKTEPPLEVKPELLPDEQRMLAEPRAPK